MMQDPNNRSPRTLLALAALTLVVVQLACGAGGQTAPTPTSSVAPTSSAATGSAPTASVPTSAPLATQPVQPTDAPIANPPTGDAREAVLATFNKLNTAFPYRLTETTTDSTSNQAYNRVAEFAGPDEVHSLWTGPYGSGEMIETGGKTYWYSNGAWSETTEDPMDAQTRFDLQQTLTQALGSAQLVGPETVNGAATFAYTFDFVLGDASGTGKVWVGAADGLPYQVDFDFTMSGVTVNSHLIYEFGVPITITAPIP